MTKVNSTKKLISSGRYPHLSSKSRTYPWNCGKGQRQNARNSRDILNQLSMPRNSTRAKAFTWQFEQQKRSHAVYCHRYFDKMMCTEITCTGKRCLGGGRNRALKTSRCKTSKPSTITTINRQFSNCGGWRRFIAEMKVTLTKLFGEWKKKEASRQ
jgi:hypothetical protein